MDKKIELIQESVKEWLSGKLSSEEAMYAIMVVAKLQEPSRECIEWANKSVMKHTQMEGSINE